jgi:hypothetical protein
VTDVELNELEQKAMEAISEVMHAIRDLSEEGCGVYNFTNEAIPAVHTLQNFVLMHWSHRIIGRIGLTWS